MEDPLINHFTGTARWWAGVAGDGELTGADYTAGDFVAAYEESVRIAAAAFEADGALARTVRLPFGEFPGAAVWSWPPRISSLTAGTWPALSATRPTWTPSWRPNCSPRHRLAITDGIRGPDGQAPFGRRPAPAGAGPRTSSPPTSAARCDLCLIARRSSRAPSGSGASCSRTAIGCSARSRTPRTWSRRPTCVPGARTTGSRAGPRCARGCTRSPPACLTALARHQPANAAVRLVRSRAGPGGLPGGARPGGGHLRHQ